MTEADRTRAEEVLLCGLSSEEQQGLRAMLMVLIYNLADTFFLAQTNDAILIAAVSLATPVFLILMAVGTVFGMAELR